MSNRLSKLGRLWQAKRGPIAVFVGVGIAAVIIGRVLASYAPADADFSITARSEVITLEVACNHHLSWDLPPGRFKTGAGDAQLASNVLGVKLRGGARARLRLGRGGNWQARFDQSPSMDCGGGAGGKAEARLDQILISADGEEQPPSPKGFVYESALPMRDGPPPTLLLHGRVVLGEEIQAGIASDRHLLVAPILRHARIEARTPDDQLGQRRLIHQETVDAGGIIDSHGCLDVPDRTPNRPGEEVLAGCVRKAGWISQGFIHVGPSDGESGFDVLLQVTGHHISVRQQGGSERRILVSAWSRFVTSTWIQISAAFVFALANLGVLGALMNAARRPKDANSAEAVESASTLVTSELPRPAIANPKEHDS